MLAGSTGLVPTAEALAVGWRLRLAVATLDVQREIFVMCANLGSPEASKFRY